MPALRAWRWIAAASLRTTPANNAVTSAGPRLRSARICWDGEDARRVGAVEVGEAVVGCDELGASVPVEVLDAVGPVAEHVVDRGRSPGAVQRQCATSQAVRATGVDVGDHLGLAVAVEVARGDPLVAWDAVGGPAAAVGIHGRVVGEEHRPWSITMRTLDAPGRRAPGVHVSVAAMVPPAALSVSAAGGRREQQQRSDCEGMSSTRTLKPGSGGPGCARGRAPGSSRRARARRRARSP